jgi:UDP-N-acetylglucosamine acyltransferase
VNLNYPLALLEKMKSSPLAYIHPDAKIAEGVTIEPFCCIYEDVEIGENSWIGPNVTIFPGARIGKNCKIHPGAVIANIPQDLKFEGEYTRAEIGDNTVIRECVTINRGTKDKNTTIVGKDCLLMAYVHVAHDCVIGDKCILANSVQLAGHVEIDYHAIVGGSSAVHQFVRIGKHVMVGGGSLVRKDVPPFITAAREPLSYEGVNTVGLRRRGFANDQISRIQDIYRFVFLEGKNISQAIEALPGNFDLSPERDEILNFMIKAEKRGIIKG